MLVCFRLMLNFGLKSLFELKNLLGHRQNIKFVFILMSQHHLSSGKISSLDSSTNVLLVHWHVIKSFSNFAVNTATLLNNPMLPWVSKPIFSHLCAFIYDVAADGDVI